MRTDTLTTTLRIDAIANWLGGIGLLAAGSWLTEPLGLGATWPLWLVAAVFLVNGTENHLVSRRPTPSTLTALIAVDVVFAIGVLALSLTDPTGADAWMRWTLAGLGDVVLVVAIAKAVGLRALRDPAGTHAPAAG